MSYAKLFSSITESSLWSEPNEVRILFVSMLAKADQNGFVEAAVPGLARLSNLPVGQVESALKVLESPDPHSKDLAEHPENEGKRILKVPGGWILLNYENYRNRRDDQQRREYMRTYMVEYRKSVKSRKQPLTGVNRGKPRLAQAEADTDTEAVRTHPPSVPKPVENVAVHQGGGGLLKDKSRPCGPGGLASFELFWEAYPKKVKRTDAEHAFIESGAHMAIEEVVRALELQKRSIGWKKDSGRYIPDPANWLRNQQWLDVTPEMVKQRMEIEKINKI